MFILSHFKCICTHVNFMFIDHFKIIDNIVFLTMFLEWINKLLSYYHCMQVLFIACQTASTRYWTICLRVVMTTSTTVFDIGPRTAARLTSRRPPSFFGGCGGNESPTEHLADVLEVKQNDAPLLFLRSPDHRALEGLLAS